jgi:GNAT superfamily N-acetyltransferase
MIHYQLAPPLLDEQLNELFASSWPGHSSRHFGPVLARSLTYITAFDGPRLVGFINVAWDGGAHAFVLDTTVRGSHKRKGIKRALVSRAVNAAREAGVEWVHVDYEPALEPFYRSCGFRPTLAGLVRLSDPL